MNHQFTPPANEPAKPDGPRFEVRQILVVFRPFSATV
jgi:hypothetical protein